MRQIRIEKVTINIGTGTDLERIEKAKKLLEILTGKKPVETVAKKRIKQWNMSPGDPIGAKVTLRGKDAEEFVKRVLESVDYKLSRKMFSDRSLTIGIKDYIDLPGIKYDPEIGMFGMDVCITFERPGYRVQRRKLRAAKVGNKHRVTAEDCIQFMKEKFGVDVV
jgi:large subunit ribosomal protein L5